jgi:DNA-binding NtrC family response regulator
VTHGPDKGAVTLVEKTRLRVGGLPSNDLQLSDPAVSGHHFELIVEQDGHRIRDLGSRNGTWIGEIRIGDALLPPKARLEVGDTRIALEVIGEQAAIEASPSERFGPLVGRSLVMRELFAQLARLARTNASVLISGETGTGKEAVAQALVEASDRANKPLEVVDCGALAPTLVESELFGHERGAFTGASESHAGAFERADGGTLLLDEIGELPLSLQPKLLRVLERHEVRRVGGSRPRRVDIRVLSATHRALEREVNQERFRGDLFYRLAVLSVHVPALRDRTEDIPLLAEHFFSKIPGAGRAALDRQLVRRLQEHSWPGNVRELRNAVERIAVGADPFSGASERIDVSSAEEVNLDTPFRLQKEQRVREFERRYAEALLAFSPDNLARAARKAGLDRMAVVKLFRRHNLAVRE